MENLYKKILRSQESRLKILNVLSFIPDNLMIKLQYFLKMGRWPNLKNPKRFSEKLNWYKLNYRTDLMTKAADKYSVREYVKSKGLDHILTKLYAVYDKPEEINMNLLPNEFVMKTTNGSGTNYFCYDKENFNLNKIKNELEIWLGRNVYGSGREWCYKNIKPRIVVEEVLKDETSDFSGINDYKILCFNGQPEYIILDVDRFIGHKRNIYDLNWKNLKVLTDKPAINREVSRPENLDELLEVATILSQDFPFVRVDLYSVNNKVYFGELTFYPWTGYIQFEPDEFDFILGHKFTLPNKKGEQ